MKVCGTGWTTFVIKQVSNGMYLSSISISIYFKPSLNIELKVTSNEFNYD